MPLNIIDTLKPKNGLDFPVVEAVDVAVEGYTSLADAVTHFATDAMIAAINTALTGKANAADVSTSVANLQGQINQIVISASAESVVAPEVAAARVGADGTEYNTLKRRIDSEVEAIHNNLFSYDTGDIKFQWENGGISSSTGAEDSNPDQIRSNKLYLRANNPIYISHSLSFYVCKYAADGTYIGYEGVWTGGHTMNLDCAYIRIVVDSTNTADGNSLTCRYTKNSFSKLTENSIVFTALDPAGYESKLANVLFPCMVTVTNDWDDVPTGNEAQYLFISVKGTANAYMQYAFVLDKAIFYTRVVSSSTASSWVKYDSSQENNTFMYRVPSAKSAAGLLSNVLTPCMFNAVSSSWDDLPTGETSVIFMNIKGNNGNAYMQFAYPLNNNKFYTRVVAPGIVNTWIKYSCSEQSSGGGYPVYTEGKKCGCLGDSITFGLKGTSWVTKLEDYCGFDTAINYGVSGSTIKSNGSDGFIDRYTSMASDLDYIVVWGGVNDFMWTDQTKAEFKTAYETLISGLLTRYPAAKFLAITPMKFEYTDSDAVGIKSTKYNVPRADGIVLKDYVDAEIEVLNKYSMPYIDFFNVGGISCESAAQAAAYFASSVDKLHPNTNGNLLILAPKISEALKRL